MTAFYLGLVIFSCLAIGVTAYLFATGRITRDRMSIYCVLLTSLIREAESMFAGMDKAGQQKKSWVLEQFHEAFAQIDGEWVSKMVDSIVKGLNSTHWE